MKKLALITTLVAATLATSTAFAAPAQGGFQDPNAPQVKYHKGDKYQNGGFLASDQAVSKVSDINAMNDDQYIVLQGKIVKQVGKEDFLFRDASGEITVEIERKAWRGQEVTPNDDVKLYGEVDKSWNKTEVEIHRVEKVK